MEGMAGQLAVVTTPWSIRDIIEHEKTGLLVPYNFVGPILKGAARTAQLVENCSLQRYRWRNGCGNLCPPVKSRSQGWVRYAFVCARICRVLLVRRAVLGANATSRSKTPSYGTSHTPRNTGMAQWLQLR